MDRRIYEMLELYKNKSKTDEINPTDKVCLNPDYCLETEYNQKDADILTMAFVNMQPIDSVYETEEGFSNGTIFPNIDKPFYGGRKI